jgi:uncharacterized protein (TIGR01777 family)
LKIAILGSGGLIGSHLAPFLAGQGHQLVYIRHGKDYDIASGRINKEAFKEVEGVINLAGEPIIGGFWTPSKKERIKKSRVESSRLLVRLVQEKAFSPQWLVNASATGFYGSRGDQTLDEFSSSGEGFLPSVVQAWEATLLPAMEMGVRVVGIRLGMVLSPQGGALKSLKTLFQLGLGGRIGDGRQYMSWIALEDVIGIIHYAITDTALEGFFNGVSPAPVTNEAFTKALAEALHRPALLPIPKWVISTFLGEMGRELLLTSCRVMPKKLLQAGYPFLYPELAPLFKYYFGE